MSGPAGCREGDVEIEGVKGKKNKRNGMEGMGEEEEGNGVEEEEMGREF